MLDLFLVFPFDPGEIIVINVVMQIFVVDNVAISIHAVR